jgi:hypothetical protein
VRLTKNTKNAIYSGSIVSLVVVASIFSPEVARAVTAGALCVIIVFGYAYLTGVFRDE